LANDFLHGIPTDASLDALLEALQNAGLGCTVVVSEADGSLRRAYANKAFADLAGSDVDTMMRTPPLMDLLSGEDRARMAAMHATVRAGAPPPSAIRTNVRRADGTHVPVEIGLGTAPMGGGRLIFVFLRDVSDNARAEAALRESEERFRALADSSPDSVTMIAKNRYVYANPIALGHLGKASLADLADYDPTTTVPPKQMPAILERMARLRAGEHVPPLQMRRASPAGDERTLETTTALVQVGGDEAIISFTRDITERVRLQAELMKKDRLASLGILAAGIGHELNNPLTAVAIQAKKLHDSADRLALPPEVKESLGQIDEAAQRMRAIISDLLFLARSAEQPQAHVDVAQVLASTVKLLQAGIGRAVDVRTEIAELPSIRGWSSKLGQVFLNVLQNAVQAVEGRTDGRVSVVARVAGETIEVVIADNGVGIAPDALPRVMEPFYTTKPGGVGLGLWISQTLLEQHGGRLELTSAAGAGTRVTIGLPLA
jgi:PAS domain S-box-containing protein